MGILYALLFTKVLNVKKVNPKKVIKTVQKESKFWILLLKDIGQLTYKIIEFVVTGIGSLISLMTKKHICPVETVEVKDDKVVDFTEYRLKKAK